MPALFATAVLLTGCATAAKPIDDLPSGHEQSLVQRHAVVTGVDRERRLLALRADDGGMAVLPVPAEFHDFDKLGVGDSVITSDTKHIAWQVKSAAIGATGVSTRQTLSNPKRGEALGGAIESAVTVTATITAFDPTRGTVTLTGPRGESQTLPARNPGDLQRVRVGDLVDITYTEGRALAVQPVPTH
ncbi:MAG: hypothetical protein M3O62_09365 [Pseudomonadota bacterium]|nr:hypothetical protein [Pseudomonadota bacterium]